MAKSKQCSAPSALFLRNNKKKIKCRCSVHVKQPLFGLLGRLKVRPHDYATFEREKHHKAAEEHDLYAVKLRPGPSPRCALLLFPFIRRDVPSLSPKRSTFTGKLPAEGSKPPAVGPHWLLLIIPTWWQHRLMTGPDICGSNRCAPTCIFSVG